MSREGALLVMAGVAVVLLALLAWAWVRRTRRDARYTAPVGELPENAVETAMFPGLYVATTRHDEPLERLAIKGLGFRSRVDITVTTLGVALDLPGQPRIALTRDRLVDAAQATVAIDRVVERDGLTRISWRIDDDTVVDTYLRPQDASAKALADAIRPLILTTGSDA
ncbi:MULTISPECIES: PH-like domain-containing protein [unclassified Microbacterium]|uniref:PH-like domain-containing protein n=1 Tax=unclassified Microbacterium TaxID=2609290 RepID=UPI0006F740CE|nr:MULTISPECIES: hypothetical protein [unclassified Microbacterium]MBD8205305.1 hypothetical protein [Microbacterium sp. CFBP 8801]MBD8218052.1 hypothetical protein [Microbacterium sp. CFBP 13617]MBD8477432.1 hypothetical protein [Microbacterium sp. CFBP 8794]MBD8509640.1 hypothetical protein [Microbacterium sp. CFBP 8790]KQR85100.1 hypothetical protein ASF96_14190 [Microbacterium sp. Leaf179]